VDYVFGWAFPGLCELQRSPPGMSLVLVCGGHERFDCSRHSWHFELSPFILQVDFIPTSRGVCSSMGWKPSNASMIDVRLEGECRFGMG